MARPAWFIWMLKKGFPLRSMWAALTRVPVLGAGIEKMLFEGDDLIVFPRESVLRVGRDLTGEGEEVFLPSVVVDGLVEKASFHWLMNNCICREATGCEKHPVDLGCLFLGEAARGIDPRLGRPVTGQEAREHLRRCREAGLFHLVGRNKLDTFWLDVGPGNRLLTICNCCTCCCLWRMLPHLSDRINSSFNRMPGLRVEVTDRCTGCGTCVQRVDCIARALSVSGGRAVIGEACRGCGRCAEACPNGAIELTIEDSGFLRAAMERIETSVDVTRPAGSGAAAANSNANNRRAG